MLMRRLSGAVLTAGAIALLATGAAHAASIDIGTASGAAGDDVTVAVSLRTMGAAVLGTQNRIEFGRETPIGAMANGQPDCAANPAIHKNATGFRFLPLGCDPAADCAAVRAVVLAFDNLDAIPDGATLYTCRIAIADDAATGTYPLRNTQVGASAANGETVQTTGTDGSIEVVEVVEEPVASIDIGSATGSPGTETTVEVTLRLLTTPPAEIAGVMNDITFDPLTPIAVAENGTRPDCTLNSDIALGVDSFSFLPQGCTPGLDCTGVHALVLAAGEGNPLPDGATLYTCTMAIAANAPFGMYPLHASEPRASGPQGEVLPILASDGSVAVTSVTIPVCTGDCDGDRAVVINELLTSVNIVIGNQPLSACSALDSSGDGTAAINEIVQAVNNALSGCPS